MALKPVLGFSLRLPIAFRNFVGFYSSLFHPYLLILLCTTHNFADTCSAFLEFIQLHLNNQNKSVELSQEIWLGKYATLEYGTGISGQMPPGFLLCRHLPAPKGLQSWPTLHRENQPFPCRKTERKLLLHRQDRGFPKAMLPSPLLTAWPPA